MKALKAGRAGLKALTIEMRVFSAILLGWGFFSLYMSMRMASGASSDMARIWQGATCANILLCGAAGYFIAKRTGGMVSWYESFLDAMPTALVAVDSSGKWLLANKAAQEILSVEPGRDIGKQCNLNRELFSGRQKAGVYAVHDKEYYVTSDAFGEARETQGYVITFTSLASIGEKDLTRRQLQREVSLVNKRIKEISAAFVKSVNQLAQCSSKQAETMVMISECLASSRNDITLEDAAKMLAVSSDSMKKNAVTESAQIREVFEQLFEVSTMLAHTAESADKPPESA